MEMPTPVPIDNKLLAILGNAKKLMKAVDEKSPIKKKQRIEEDYDSEYDIPSTPPYSEMDERDPQYDTPTSERNIHSVSDYTPEQIKNSNLPQVVKEAMLNKPIAKIKGIGGGFSLEGLESLIDKPEKQPIRESRPKQNSEMITISKTELNEMIDKRISEVLANMFAKTITEQTIKRTINTLISEGKLVTKKK